MKRGLAVTYVFLLVQQLAWCQKLKTGDKAPDFTGTAATGEMISLSQYKGQKVLLAFFRYASCPVCNFRTHELLENFDSISAKDIKIIAVYESDNKTINEYMADTHLPYPVIGDPELTLYKKYSLEKSLWKTMGALFHKETKAARANGKKLFRRKFNRDGNLSRLPADFIIDEYGIVKVAHYATGIGDHLPVSEILKN